MPYFLLADLAAGFVEVFGLTFFIGFSQHIISQVSSHSQGSSTKRTKPQVLHTYFSPLAFTKIPTPLIIL